MKRIRDYGIKIGSLRTGKLNSITDVDGVTVGHVTLSEGEMQTGVTTILPHSGNLFQEKVMASSYVMNGFGKTVGTVQMEELGTIETPIILTNTLSVGTASDALIRYMLEQNPAIGVTTGTVNPVIGECNDGFLNDIRGLHVTREHVWEAISRADKKVMEGAVGAGTGMSCYGLKGGIGTSSRMISLGEQEHVIGVLVLSNFGRLPDLRLDGYPVGRWIVEWEQADSSEPDKGSIIFIVATDLPLTERQLNRLAKRVSIGLSRTGSFIAHGSGDIAIAFSTANRIQHEDHRDLLPLRMLNEEKMDLAFRAVAEATEEAILNSLIAAETKVGREGHVRKSLNQFMDKIMARILENPI